MLRPSSYRATLRRWMISAASKMPEVIVVRDGDFVGVAAPMRSSAKTPFSL